MRRGAMDRRRNHGCKRASLKHMLPISANITSESRSVCQCVRARLGWRCRSAHVRPLQHFASQLDSCGCSSLACAIRKDVRRLWVGAIECAGSPFRSAATAASYMAPLPHRSALVDTSALAAEAPVKREKGCTSATRAALEPRGLVGEQNRAGLPAHKSAAR